MLVSPNATWPGFFGPPVKLFEYIAARKAIVASRLGQIGEILRDGETGPLVPPGDRQALPDALERLHVEAEFCGRLGRAARRRREGSHLGRSYRAYAVLKTAVLL